MAKKNKPAKTQIKRTPKRRTAIPATRSRAAIEPVTMRLVTPPEEIQPSYEMIADRAYQIWEQKLRAANDAVANWLEAESQLRKKLNSIQF